jgi:hypothetical protein
MKPLTYVFIYRASEQCSSLTQCNFVVSWFWRLEVQGQGVGRAPCENFLTSSSFSWFSEIPNLGYFVIAAQMD